MSGCEKIRFVDSHTAGEPTRVVIDGGPDLGNGTVAEKLERLRNEHDSLRTGVVCEPRGSDVLVGAILVKPAAAGCVAGVLFFNNVGYLGMCGHGMIGVAATMRHLGLIGAGTHRIETPVGVVTIESGDGGRVSVRNVPSRRAVKGLVVQTARHGPVLGDVAWGGNWFFISEAGERPLDLANVESLTDLAWDIRSALTAQGRSEVDHVELVGPADSKKANAKNFVLCPGKAYDRSPCGTGTSAKMACLAADGKLGEGEDWRQEGIAGEIFLGTFKWLDRGKGWIEPTVTGAAFVTAVGEIILDERDPFCWGIGTKAATLNERT